MEWRALHCSLSLLVIALGSGCEMTGLIRENTQELKTTNEGIAKNTAAVTATTQTMQGLESGLQQVGSLKGPMQDLATLGPTFNKVADLGSPMKELAGLREPMVQLAALGPTFNQVAGLDGPMKELAALKVSLDQVAKLEKPMSDVARLEGPLTEMGQLSRPVAVLGRLTPLQLAASGVVAVLVFFALLFLTIWGAVRLSLRHHPA